MALSAECPGCGSGVDPLRAGQVAILGDRFVYFCGPDCKAGYLRSPERLPELDAPTAEPPRVVPTPPPRPPHFEADALPRASQISPRSEVTSRPPHAAPALRGSLDREPITLGAIDSVGIACGLLVPSVGLLGEIAEHLKFPLAAASCAAVALRLSRVKREACDAHRAVVVLPALAALIAAAWASATHQPPAAAIVVFAGLAAAVTLAAERILLTSRARTITARDEILRALDVPVRVVRGEQLVLLRAEEVRVGEQVLVEPGEVVGVDATVSAGAARVRPWLGALFELSRGSGDALVAGAQLVTGSLRLRATWSGVERACVELLGAPQGRIDVSSDLPRALRTIVERGAVVAAALVGVASITTGASAAVTVASMAAAGFVFGAPLLPSFVALHLARAQLAALAHGIFYKDPRAFDRAAATDIAVLGARGTLLMGEPELVGVELLGRTRGPERAPSSPAWHEEVDRLLALAAGAEAASAHPFAAAILRAARSHGVRPDPVRNATAHAGLGVTALSSSGERLVVGGRAIMLELKIGGALADPRVGELEAEGRSVLFVAVGDRLVGLIALQDGLRPGARAAVQQLLDARIEPVLLSGEARDTCETLGRALDIEHIRPDVLPTDRGAEVRALAEGGAVVAVIGHPTIDDAALGAADVAVALGAAGSTPGEWAISLASDDVQNAARALAIARSARARAWVAVTLTAPIAIAALLTLAFGIAPLAAAPLAILAAVVAVGVHAREWRV